MAETYHDFVSDTPRLNDWIVARSAGSWDLPHLWEVGQIQAEKDARGSNRTMFVDAPLINPLPYIRYVIAGQVIGVYETKEAALAARDAAAEARILMAPVEDTARRALDDIRRAINTAQMRAAVAGQRRRVKEEA